jgi:predicted nucleic acid-binding protein
LEPYLKSSAVADASILIVLAKIRQMHLLSALYGSALIGPIVYEEAVVQGRQVRALGVEQIEQALAEGLLQIARPAAVERQLTTRLLRTTGLDDREAEAIALASSRHLILIVDDKEARHTAAALGIEYIGTAGMLLRAYFGKHLNMEELEDAVAELTKVLWLSPGIVAEILRQARGEDR